MGHFGAIWGSFGGSLGLLGAFQGTLEGIWGQLGVFGGILGHFGAVLGSFEGIWAQLGAAGSLWGQFGAFLGQFGAFWGQSGAFWGQSGAFWGLFQDVSGPFRGTLGQPRLFVAFCGILGHFGALCCVFDAPFQEQGCRRHHNPKLQMENPTEGTKPPQKEPLRPQNDPQKSPQTLRFRAILGGFAPFAAALTPAWWRP